MVIWRLSPRSSELWLALGIRVGIRWLCCSEKVVGMKRPWLEDFFMPPQSDEQKQKEKNDKQFSILHFLRFTELSM